MQRLDTMAGTMPSSVQEKSTVAPTGYRPPNVFVKWMLGFLSPLFTYLKVDPNYAALVQSYLARGRVVLVMRVRSGIDFLYFSWLHRELGLPAPEVANGIHPIFYQSGRELFRTTWSKLVRWVVRRETASYRTRTERMLDSVRNGGVPVMFLAGARKVFGGRAPTDDPTSALFALQKEIPEPIFLLPQLILWTKDPQKFEKGPLDLLFGERDYPGIIRKVALFIRFHRRAFVKTGEPIELREFSQSLAEVRPEILAKKLRRTLRVFLAREERVIRGPLLKPRARILRAILKERDTVDALKLIARDENVDYERIEKKAYKYLDEIAADYSMTYLEGFNFVLTQVWKRLYDRFYVDDVGLQKVREAARSGPLLLVPNHRSHMDYLILSYVFFNNDLMPPHIAAGINLSFWPMGPIFRGSGAFFLRRSFRGNRLYATVFEAYVRKLIREGYNLEFFIEGTRSRTGKMLPPKLGMLSMVADAVLERPDIKHAWIVPVSVDYERIIEESSYVKELQGGSKEKESFVGVIKASKHVRTNYGRAFVQFADPIPLREYLEERTQAPGAAVPAAVPAEALPGEVPEEAEGEWARETLIRKEVVEELGYRIVNTIRSVATITHPQIVAAAILVHHKRGIAREALLENVNTLYDALEAQGARFSTDFAGVDFAPDKTLELFKNQRFVTEIHIAGQIVYASEEQRRLALDFYKNGILGHLYGLGFVALAFRANRTPTFDDLTSIYRTLKELFDTELNLKYDTRVDEAVQDALGYFMEKGYLEFDSAEAVYRVRRPHRIGIFQQLYLNFLESYYVVIVTVLAEAAEGKVETRVLAPRAMEIGRLLYAKGDLGRPESTSKVNIDLATKLLTHHGILEMRSISPEAKRKGKKTNFYFLTERGRPWLEEMKLWLEGILFVY